MLDGAGWLWVAKRASASTGTSSSTLFAITRCVRSPRLQSSSNQADGGTQTSWDAVRHSLERDPRFDAPSLSPRDKRDLFERHLSDLYDKRLAAVEAQFGSASSSLATRYRDVRSDLLKNSAVERLNVSERRLEDLFAAWQRRRNDTARRDFDSMLSESSFVEFWGRMRKDALSNRAEKDKKVLEDEDEEEEDDGGVVDLREMAKGIDLGEVEAVLRKDQRWIVFDHVPEQREQWMRVRASSGRC